MLTQFSSNIAQKQHIVIALTHLRLDWEDAAADEGLISMQASVGLMLSDMVDLLGFTIEERSAVLGDRLSEELDLFLGPSADPVIN